MKFWRNIVIGADTLRELLSLFSSEDRWWLLPLVTILILFGIVLVLAATSPLGPFIYALF